MGENNTPQCNWLEMSGLISAASLAFIVLAWIIHPSAIPLFQSDHPLQWPTTITLSLLITYCTVHFIWSFTRDIGPSKDDKSLPPQLRIIFIYGYIFMFASLGLCAIPFLVSAPKPTEKSRPAGIVVGCRSTACEDPEWFLHIGSSMSIPVATQNQEPPGDQTDGASRTARQCPTPVIVEGGLAVPLYVVLLALMGGAVSMIRRMPEFQKASESQPKKRKKKRDNNRGDPKVGPPKMAPPRARELVVFEIMQMFTAPLIATTAYAVFTPATTAAGSLLGFLSGFSSETILRSLRNVSRALVGELDDNPEPKERPNKPAP